MKKIRKKISKEEEKIFRIIGLVWALSIGTNFPISEFNFKVDKIVKDKSK